MNRRLVLLVILLFTLYVVLYKRKEDFVEDVEEANVVNRHRERAQQRVQQPPQPHNYLLPEVYRAVNTKVDRINELRQDLHATGLAEDNAPHNLRVIHDDLLQPEVEYFQPEPTDQLKVLKKAYTPDWHRHPQQNATVHILNYQRYANSDHADPDGIEPYDSTQSMNNAYIP